MRMLYVLMIIGGLLCIASGPFLAIADHSFLAIVTMTAGMFLATAGTTLFDRRTA